MQCLNLKVLIINHTDTVASFFEDWNSWGYFNIHFQVKTNDSTYNLVKLNRDWPKNYPSFKSLFPGDTLTLLYSLNYGYCVDSRFSGTITRSSNRSSIKVVYQLYKEALEDAFIGGEIKYKYEYKKKPGRRSRENDWIIVDSLKAPVEVKRTFPLARLESAEYELK